jgi:hypothetical protein
MGQQQEPHPQVVSEQHGAILMDPTQWGDEVAEQMRAYYEAHHHEKYVEGTADNLMIGLLNIAHSATAAIEATRIEKLQAALLEALSVVKHMPISASVGQHGWKSWEKARDGLAAIIAKGDAALTQSEGA